MPDSVLDKRTLRQSGLDGRFPRERLPRGSESAFRGFHRWWLGCLLIAFAIAVGGSVLAAARTDPGILDEVNRRWKGARCRIRIQVPIKNASDSQGWSKSPRIVGPTESGAYTSNPLEAWAAVRISVSDLAALRPILRAGSIPPGTTFIAEGWRLEDPKRGTGPVLELRFADLPVRARISFVVGLRKKLPLDKLGIVDLWLRLSAFQLSAVDEQLVDVPRTAEAGPGDTRARGREPVLADSPASAPASDPSLGILGVAVDPSRVAPGSEVRLIITYDVGGPPPGGTFDVVERRTILQDGETLTTLEATVARGSGTHKASQPLRLPATLAPGIYELRASVLMPGITSAGSALFQVRSP